MSFIHKQSNKQSIQASLLPSSGLKLFSGTEQRNIIMSNLKERARKSIQKIHKPNILTVRPLANYKSTPAYNVS